MAGHSLADNLAKCMEEHKIGTPKQCAIWTKGWINDEKIAARYKNLNATSIEERYCLYTSNMYNQDMPLTFVYAVIVGDTVVSFVIHTQHSPITLLSWDKMCEALAEFAHKQRLSSDSILQVMEYLSNHLYNTTQTTTPFTVLYHTIAEGDMDIVVLHDDAKVLFYLHRFQSGSEIFESHE